MIINKIFIKYLKNLYYLDKLHLYYLNKLMLNKDYIYILLLLIIYITSIN